MRYPGEGLCSWKNTSAALGVRWWTVSGTTYATSAAPWRSWISAVGTGVALGSGVSVGVGVTEGVAVGEGVNVGLAVAPGGSAGGRGGGRGAGAAGRAGTRAQAHSPSSRS